MKATVKFGKFWNILSGERKELAAVANFLRQLADNLSGGLTKTWSI